MQNDKDFTSYKTGITLQKGDSGTAVTQLKELLNAQGSTLPTDDTFDSATLSAVISFQQKHGLPVNGVIDSQTWTVLQKVTHS
ncbi:MULTISPECIES: peptidoglycan-binding domain-containing protein [Nostocales]|uniref:Peptidoglycan-binding protein n=3 Tax=Nostocales TaxID=1161 RepID=A0A8S9SX44_9CYAN|nr:peptidoglycan-binding domain-containing protein [Tolypothrix bouteillei]KAF3883843.1 peptidoglycan-binding protein [Tolypothrix bouteillei VB521301]